MPKYTARPEANAMNSRASNTAYNSLCELVLRIDLAVTRTKQKKQRRSRDGQTEIIRDEGPYSSLRVPSDRKVGGLTRDFELRFQKGHGLVWYSD